MGRPASSSQSAAAEQRADQGLTASIARRVGQRLAIGDGVRLIDPDAKASRGVGAGLVQLIEVLIWIVELGGNLGDKPQRLVMEARDGLVEERAGPRGCLAIGGDREVLVAEVRSREMLLVAERSPGEEVVG